MKSSLVLELQALAQSGSTDLSELLRRAKVVAVKLDLKEPLIWIDHELNGYPDKAALPTYRQVPSELRMKNPFHGLVPIQFEKADWVWKHFSSSPLRQSLGEIVELASGEGTQLHGVLSPPELELLSKLGCDVHLPIVRVIPKNTVAAILDAVRNQVLNWSLELERQGILGEGMTFTTDERQKALTSTTVNHINYGLMVQGDNNAPASGTGPATTASNSSIGAIAGGTAATASGHVQDVNDLAEVRRLVTVLVSELQQVPLAHRGDILEHGADLLEEVRKDSPKKSKVKATLGAIGSGITAVITWAPKAVDAFEKIKHLLGSG